MVGDTFNKQAPMRVYANGVKKCAVFDVDYRLAPKDHFPKGLNDCWQGYTWVVNNVKEIFGIDYKKVIVMGDSAGGNLSVAVTALAIERKFRVPDLIMPIYPNIINSLKQFVPAQLNAFNYSVLSPGFILHMYRNYTSF